MTVLFVIEIVTISNQARGCIKNNLLLNKITKV